MALTDTLTTREALRRAVCDDIVDRADIVAQTIGVQDLEGIEGVRFVSMGVLRDQVAGHLMVELPDPSEHHAEVSTPATITVSAICPECLLAIHITVKLTPSLTVDDDGAEISVKAKTKARPHVHGQLSLPEDAPVADGQVGMDEVIVIDDLRLRILAAVAAVSDAWGDLKDPGPPPTVDAIAQQLELANDSDRGDLEESLHAYSQLETPLVDVVSAKAQPTHYVLTEAGIAMLADAAAALAVEEDADDESADAGPGDAP